MEESYLEDGMPKLHKDLHLHQLLGCDCQLDSEIRRWAIIPIKWTAAVGFLFPFSDIPVVT
jgi:hypothetical protein